MAPKGLRNQTTVGRETRSNSQNKPSTRGGISKRRAGPTKLDTDGDLDMDPARRAKKPSNTDLSNSKSRPNTRSSTTNARGASRTAQTVLKHLTGGDPTTLATRISKSGTDGRINGNRVRGSGLTYLRVHGLKKSKAASNPDGGLHGLLGFLERKASAMTGAGNSKRQIIIKKVSPNAAGRLGRHLQPRSPNSNDEGLEFFAFK